MQSLVDAPRSPFGGTGRPKAAESERRRVEFVRLVAAGTPLVEAARIARIKPERALALLDTPEMRRLIALVAA
jgi:hypothetical protein